MKKLIAALIICFMLVGCTNVRLTTEKKETTTEPPTPKQAEATIPPGTNTTVPIQAEGTQQEEAPIEDFGDII